MTPPHSGERKQTRVEKRQVENADKYPDTCFCADPNAPYCRVHDPGPFPDSETPERCPGCGFQLRTMIHEDSRMKHEGGRIIPCPHPFHDDREAEQERERISLIAVAIPPSMFDTDSDDELWEAAAPTLREQIRQARAALNRIDKPTYSAVPDPLPIPSSDQEGERCECGAAQLQEPFCPAHRRRWEYQQDEDNAHAALDKLGVPRHGDPPDDVIYSVAGRITQSASLLDAAEKELEAWKAGVERMLGGGNVCSKLRVPHRYGRDPECPICCPVLSDLVAEHRQVADEALVQRDQWRAEIQRIADEPPGRYDTYPDKLLALLHPPSEPRPDSEGREE